MRTSKIKNALLSGQVVENNGWSIHITAEDEVEIWPPRGAGFKTSFANLDRAITDFKRKAEMPIPSINESIPPKDVSDGELGPDSSTKNPFTVPKINDTDPEYTAADPEIPAGNPSAFAMPGINPRDIPNSEDVSDGDLGPDSSIQPTNWGDKKVTIQEDGRISGHNREAWDAALFESDDYPSSYEDEDAAFIEGMQPDVQNIYEKIKDNPVTLDIIQQEMDRIADWDMDSFDVDAVGGDLADAFGKDEPSVFWKEVAQLFLNAAMPKSSRVIDSFMVDQTPDFYRQMRAKSPSRELLEDIANPDKWAANNQRYIRSQYYHGGDLDSDMSNPHRQTKDEPGSMPYNQSEYDNFHNEAVAPPGEKWEQLVKDLKKDPNVDNPWAVAWSQYNKSKESRRLMAQDLPSEDDVKFSIDAQHSDIDPAMYLDGGDLNYVMEGLNHNNPWFWASVLVVAQWQSPDGDLYEGHGIVDPVSYDSKEAFLHEGDDYARGKEEAYSDLIQNINDGVSEASYPKSKHAAKDPYAPKIQDAPKYDASKMDLTDMADDSDRKAEMDETVGYAFRDEVHKRAQDLSIYQQLVDAGVPIDTHESDLYALVTDESTAIIENYKFKNNVTIFRDNIDGDLWYDIPFANDTFWSRIQQARKQAGPKLREKWDDVGGYNRDLEAESAEELYHLVRSFGSSDPYDWSAYKPSQPMQGGNLAGDKFEGDEMLGKEAVDEDAKKYYKDYYGGYGKELVKDIEPGTPEKKDKKKDKKAQQSVDPNMIPGQQNGLQNAPVSDAGPAAPSAAPKPSVPKPEPNKAPGAGNAALTSLGWTEEEIQSMSEDEKQKIIQINLHKPGTQKKAPVQQPSQAPKAPATQAPATPAPAPIEPSPVAARLFARALENRIRIRKAQDALTQSPASAEPAPVVPTSSSDIDTSTTEGQAFQILQDVRSQAVSAASPISVTLQKSEILSNRLITELGMSLDEAKTLYGVRSINKLFQ
jgi:hypothetical protein